MLISSYKIVLVCPNTFQFAARAQQCVSPPSTSQCTLPTKLLRTFPTLHCHAVAESQVGSERRRLHGGGEGGQRLHCPRGSFERGCGTGDTITAPLKHRDGGSLSMVPPVPSTSLGCSMGCRKRWTSETSPSLCINPPTSLWGGFPTPWLLEEQSC